MSKEFYTDKEYEEILLTLGESTTRIDDIENPLVKDQINKILQHFDAVHREPLSRMVKFLQENHADLLEKMREDYTVRQLLALYDLGAFTGVETAKDQVAFISADQVKMLRK